MDSGKAGGGAQPETVREAYARIRRELTAAGVPDAAVSAAALLGRRTGFSKQELLARGGEPLRCDLAALRADVERRAAREPLQYILGRWPFFGLEFEVGPGVLIPRPDTEVLVETALEFLKDREAPRLLDLCAGSGCIGIALAKTLPESRICSVEFSKQALFWLRRNAALHGMEGRMRILKADMLAEGTPGLLARAAFDALLCNPPYIPSGEIAALEPEVARFEPRAALDGGGDGLVFYRAAARFLPLLRAGGLAAFEVGAGQAEDAAELLRGFGLRDVFTRRDYGGIERVAGGVWPGETEACGGAAGEEEEGGNR